MQLPTSPVKSAGDGARDKYKSKRPRSGRYTDPAYLRKHKHTGKIYQVEGDKVHEIGHYDGGWKPGDRDQENSQAFVYENGWKYGQVHGQGTLKFHADGDKRDQYTGRF